MKNNWVHKIKHFFGWDSKFWIYNKNHTRTCYICHKKQKASYDPMYGTTDWKNVKCSRSSIG